MCVKDAIHEFAFIQKKEMAIWKKFTKFVHSYFIDVEWGDAVFYQHPDFDPVMAFKALFYKTLSTLRVDAFSTPLKNYIEVPETLVKININDLTLKKLVKYIHNAYYCDKNNRLNILSMHNNGNIIFYKAKGE